MKLFCIITIMLSVFLFSCKEKKLPDVLKKNTIVRLPDTVLVPAPEIVFIDTCPKPYVMIYSGKGQNSIRIPGKGNSNILPLFPPVLNEIHGGAHGGLAFIQNYNTEHGLALSGVSCAYTDKLGNLWFGTYGGGISKFDGRTFTNYNTANGLAGNVVTCMVQDRKGNYWFGTNGRGISRYNGEYFENYTTAQGLVNNKVSGIAEDSAGNIWIATDGGISKSVHAAHQSNENISFVNFTTKQGLIVNSFSCVAVDNGGDVWFGTQYGLSRYNHKAIKSPTEASFTNFTKTEGLIGNNVRSILIDKTGNVWVGTEGGVNKFLPEKSEEETGRFTAAAHFQGTVLSMIEDARGAIWLTLGGDGVIKYDPKDKPENSVTYFGEHQGFSNKLIYNGTLDKKGNLWFGTYSKGLIKYEGESVCSYTQEHGLIFDKVWCIAEDKSRNLWFGTSSGLSMYNEKLFTNYSRLHETSHAIRSIVKDKSGNLWYASGGGLTKYDGNTFVTYTTEQGLPLNSTLCIVEDRKGNIWCGTYGSGVTKFDQKSFTNYNTEHGLINNVVKCIIEDSKGNLWFGTNGGGVSKYDGKHFINYSVEQGLPDNTVYDIVEDKVGNIWFATAGGGGCRFDGATFTTYTVGEGLADNVVYALEEDTINNIMWFGTNLGLSALHLSTSANPDQKVRFENFNNLSGYPIKDVNTGSLYIDSKGILWAGTGDKLVRFDYKEVHRSTDSPVVFIQSLKVQSQQIGWHTLGSFVKSEKGAKYKSKRDSLTAINEEIGAFNYVLTDEQRNLMFERFGDIKFDSVLSHYFTPQNLILPYHHNNLTFSFGIVETDRPQLVKYQFMLEGYDETWSPVTSETSANFGNIYEGSYTFKLKAQSPDGVWGEPVTYSFKVLPPWYRSWWMYTFYFVFGALLIFILLRLNSRRLRLRANELAEEVRKATAEILEQKKTVEEQKLIVEEKNKDILDSIFYAKRIQDALLSDEEHVTMHLPSHFILYLPKDIVSGDFYWAIEKKYINADSGKTEHYWYVAVVDCTGHGVPGAFMSMLGMVFLNEIVSNNKLYTPAAILNELRDKVVKDLGQTGKREDTQDGMDISLLRLNIETNEIQWAGANNSLNLLRGGELSEIKADKQPIGYYPEPRPFTNHAFQLKKGDYIYIFSDGYADQFGGSKGKKFKYKQLEQLLVSNSSLPMHQQKSALKKVFNEWKGTLDQMDDVCIIGIKI